MKTICACMSIFLMLMACSPVPVTGRRQLQLVPESQIQQLSSEQYQQFITENPAVSGTRESEMVKTVGNNIRTAVETFFTKSKEKSFIDEFKWEFNLIQDTLINAWAMPGGKVVVYSGILPVAQNDTGLAVVIGHEIAHAVAQHGNERMSQLLIAQLGGIALGEALKTQPERTQQLAFAAFGIGAQLGVLLPYSRLHETEADRLGLIFMAIAGYDPHAAIPFWERMSAAKQGVSPPEFLSTHPSDKNRIENLRAMLPEAMKYFRGNTQAGIH